MKRSTLLSLTAFLALLGLGDSAYLAEAALTDTPLTCNVEGLSGCNVVAQSVYSHLFGIPLGVYGIVFYGLLLALALIASVRTHRGFDVIMGLFGLAGIAASVVFLYIQLVLIKALCVYCLGSAVIAFLLFLTTAGLFYKAEKAVAPGVPSL